MISSTFTDLEQHWLALIAALKGEGLTDVDMGNNSAKADVDVIDSSLQMVRDASAYAGLISHKYGQTPYCPKRNPDRLSLTELEFNEAQRLGRPILLFIMGDAHPVRKADVETDPENKKKLDVFRERAKQMRPDSPVHRVYATFDSIEEFTPKAIHAAAGLRRHLDEKDGPRPQPAAPCGVPEPIPAPPAFYAEPPYIGSHQFTGRRAELERLSDWAAPADAHPVLLFDAIGGSGKSMLTWQWTTTYATRARGDWAGRFWYSFYERGAIMADFCGCALAYITREPFDEFKKLKTPELARRLLHHLRDRPWLLVLDGLERVLVAYQRIDAAEVPDEEANQPTDQIAERDPRSAIRPEDDDLLRALAAAAPSKLLITSRLVPRVLLNAAGQPIPGVERFPLPGLRPPDAEALFRSCGVTGNSEAIQTYLQSHCDCHPLVTGALAGLINDYLADKGNFDAWVADDSGGGRLDLASLDLVQKRNHILKAALAAVPETGRRLLSLLSLLSEAVDSATLRAVNSQFGAAELSVAVRDLERRGLLQYDGRTKRYDLHPVVRGVAAGGLRAEEKESYGQRVVDHFSVRPHSPYEQAETIEDVRDGLQVVRTLLRMGHYQQAHDVYRGALSQALVINLEAHAEVLSLLRPFFPHGWAALPTEVNEHGGAYLANEAANALNLAGERKGSLDAYGASLAVRIRQANWVAAVTVLANIAVTLRRFNRLAQENRCRLWVLDIATLSGDKQSLFSARLDSFDQLALIGQWEEGQAIWDLLDAMGRGWSRAAYRPGDAETYYVRFRLWRGDLSEEHLSRAEQLAREGWNRVALRYLHGLRGEWRLERGEWDLAAASLHEAVAMARAVGQADVEAETQLALARFHLGQLADPRSEAKQLASAARVSHLDLAELWLAIGDRAQAKTHALAAYKSARADGEPYVQRYDLNKACALLEQLGAEIPTLPPYDPSRDEKFPWEDDVAAAIEKLRAEKEAGNRKKN